MNVQQIDVREEIQICKEKLRGMLQERAASLYTRLKHIIPDDLKGTLLPEDVLREVWSLAFVQIGEFRSHQQGGFDKWLYRIADLQLYAHIHLLRSRKQNHQCKLNGLASRWGRPVNPLDFERPLLHPLSNEASSIEVIECLQTSLSSIPKQHRQAIITCYLDGKSWTDVTGEQEETVSSSIGPLSRDLSNSRINLAEASTIYSYG